MFLKKVSIKNFRCFSADSEPIDLNIPDGTAGSGLNIIVGENGTGKTAFLEAIDLLTKNPFSARNKIDISDFIECGEEMIEINGETDQEFEVKKLWGSDNFKAKGFRFFGKLREADNKNKLLDPIVVDTEYLPVDESNVKPVEKRQAASGPYNAERLKNFSIFYFEKNKSRHLTSSTYQTRFGEVMDDLNFQFLNYLNSKTPEQKQQLSQWIDTNSQKLQTSTKDKIISQTVSKIEKFLGIQNLRLDFMQFLAPYTNAILVHRAENSLQQIPVAKMGSGIETVCALLFLDTIFDSDEDSIVYCIDEPEMHLHPQAQLKLLELFVQMSAKKQIILATHSPYFTDPSLLDKILRFTKTDENKIEVKRISDITLKDQIKPERNFFFRHRDIFFAPSAVFVEGSRDIERYTIYLEKNGFNNVIASLQMMNGCDKTFLYEKFCNEFGVKFFGLVDADFSIERSKWARNNRKKVLKDLKEFIKVKGIEFDEATFDTAMDEELRETPKVDDRATEEIEWNGVSLLKIKSKNIFVLRHGEIEDYLDSAGIETIPDRGTELQAIFDYINSNL